MTETERKEAKLKLRGELAGLAEQMRIITEHHEETGVPVGAGMSRAFEDYGLARYFHDACELMGLHSELRWTVLDGGREAYIVGVTFQRGAASD